MAARGDIWAVNLDPTQSSEIRKSRPCVVVSPPEMLEHLRTVLVAPMTSKGQSAPFRIPITHDGQKGLVLLDQIRAVDKTRLVRKSGRTSSSTLANIIATLQTIFGP
ncbi:MAG TPA: type II toxin-antitoxin system PemK/MazF family toxin [Pseudomonadota bacterium]|nr:type II toxin-antitoxin system PemK/MazF family toxin [Pseudomonadota bacterium]